MITGTVKDAITGETLPQANVFISDNTGKITGENRGTAADSAGKYALEAEKGEYVTASYVGYTARTVAVNSGNQKTTFTLQPSATLGELTITATDPNKARRWWWFLIIAAAACAMGYYVSKR